MQYITVSYIKKHWLSGVGSHFSCTKIRFLQSIAKTQTQKKYCKEGKDVMKKVDIGLSRQSVFKGIFGASLPNFCGEASAQVQKSEDSPAGGGVPQQIYAGTTKHGLKYGVIRGGSND